MTCKRYFWRLAPKDLTSIPKPFSINYRVAIPPEWAIIACVVTIQNAAKNNTSTTVAATAIARIAADSNANNGSRIEWASYYLRLITTWFSPCPRTQSADYPQPKSDVQTLV